MAEIRLFNTAQNAKSMAENLTTHYEYCHQKFKFYAHVVGGSWDICVKSNYYKDGEESEMRKTLLALLAKDWAEYLDEYL